ncbi:hydrogenase formation protein HypD [Myxococcota bacterium]|nr:hydrogenase formation protein HypD [Myxococcota bacterium]MCZ7617783.1 hydrogenase formation protein HypD [Myxococcota bacterium]
MLTELPTTRGASLQFRDPARARALLAAIERLTADRAGGAPLSIMHVCGSHEQAIARFGLRAVLPPTLQVIMGPGCPVCVTDAPEVDEAVALAEAGLRVASYGDMLRVPGSGRSLDDARADGARVEVVYGVAEALTAAQAAPDEPLVFFASGFETTAVATAAVLLRKPPPNFLVLSAHKYIPPVMEIVAEMPHTRVEGFLAAGHAAAITGYGVFEPFVARHRIPVVVGGFEPLDLLAGFAKLAELARDGEARVVNAFPRLVSRDGNRRAQQQLWRVFEPVGGQWRGIARVPNGNLRLRPEFAGHDARRRFAALLAAAPPARLAPRSDECRCGDILSGSASPRDCALFGAPCTPAQPVGACMVSSEGTCRIWHEYGGIPRLEIHEAPS